MAPDIVVTNRLPDSALSLLSENAEVWVSPEERPLTSDELHEAIAGAKAVVTFMRDTVDASFFDAAGPQLRCVCNVAVGFDNIDLAEAARRGVQITNTPDVLTAATADLTFALILGVTRRLAEGDRLIRARTPWSWSPDFMLGRGLQGKTLGLIGLGRIGSAVAQRARAFGMEIAYTDPVDHDPALIVEVYAQRLPLDELARIADVLSIHCPLVPETVHLVDAALLARMKSTAFLINAARGQIVDEEALVKALQSGTIAGAGLDVFEHEPEVPASLLKLDNVVLLPHVGSATLETRTAMAKLAAQNALAVLAGRAPLTPVLS